MKVSTKIGASLLLLLNFLLLHYIVSSIPLRFDLTSEGIYTLSDSSKDLLSKVEDPISVDLYSTRSIADLPPWFKTFAARVEQMLEQYERSSGGKLRLRVIDPEPDTEEEEQAIAAGLHGQEIASGDRVFLGMVVAQGDKEVTHPFFDWNRENFLEYDISKLIYEVQQFTKPKLGLITSLQLQAPPYPTMPGQQPPQEQYIIEQLEATFEIAAIEQGASELPNDLDLLAIIHPQDQSEELLYAIDQFALSGRPIFLALDPASVQMREQSRQMQMMGQGMGQGASSDLPRLLESWGLQYDPSKVLVDQNIGLAQGNFTQPAWLVFDGDHTNRDLLPSSELQGVLLLEAGALTPTEGATTTWEPVLTTSADAAQLEAMLLQFTQPTELLKQAEPVGEAVAVAGMLTGEAATAFPEGDPGAATDEPQGDDVETDADAASSNPDHRDSGNITVFAISDTDWLLDRFSIERINFLGMRNVRRMNDNQTLAANFMEYLGGSEDLIGIRGKGTTNREFEVVKAMEVEAQKAYQAKLQAVEEELAQISQKISQIISEQQGSGVIYMTPEIEAVLQENREQEAALRAERRTIRRELRQGIERLGTILGAINLLWAPVGLAIFGILYSRSRKQK